MEHHSGSVNHSLSIPVKIAPELVGQDLITMQNKLKTAIYEALRELAGYDGDKITQTVKQQKMR